MPRPTDRKGRYWIRPLPERLVNKIAAGEVVERPSSVVKELVENSLDAGADRIEISIEKSGTKLIKVVDNGCGIPDEQIEIAFSRHATSKISEFRDLDSIRSYGFRGEALPSIASVSRMRMVSRTSESETGTEIIFEGGVLQSKAPVAAPVGTSIEVEDLFFNTPARRKFLKAESTELRHISRASTALAIGAYRTGFSFTSNGRQIFAEPPDQDLATRAGSLLAPGKTMIQVSGELGPVKLEGLIGPPELGYGNRSAQYIFVNGRLVQAPSLSHALVAGYGELMPRGKFPVGALLLVVDPAEVDVNVHPAKTEVRLSREREIHDALYRLVRQSLQQDGIIPEVRLPGSPGHPEGVRAPRDADRPISQGNSARIPGIRDLAASNQEFLSKLYSASAGKGLKPGEKIVRVDTATGEILSEPVETTALTTPGREALPESGSGELRLLGCFADLYLLFQRSDELLIVDQHTAHERVLFEDISRRIEASAGLASQQLLLPVQIEVSPERLAIFEEARSILNDCGFTLSPFGGRTIRIEAVPAVLSKKSPEKSVLSIIDDIAASRKGGHDLQKAMAESIACRSAVMAGDRLTDREAVSLVRSLLACENRYSCPHGRPTYIRMSRSDLDRQFGRG
ncbi:MAG: DNA mismatch repair endonuclease MutL [Candidatus Zixiibacteriota bacterium]|nr:MAG: DNA mismatch repair endonuclease MutL [candidate division Zixibacteria bacterium]